MLNTIVKSTSNQNNPTWGKGKEQFRYGPSPKNNYWDIEEIKFNGKIFK